MLAIILILSEISIVSLFSILSLPFLFLLEVCAILFIKSGLVGVKGHHFMKPVMKAGENIHKIIATHEYYTSTQGIFLLICTL